MTRRTTTTLLFVLGAALVAVLGVLVLGPHKTERSLSPGVPEIVSTSRLSEIAANSATQPLYWLGERDHSEYEVTETKGGRFYVRYLNEGSEAGNEQPDFVTVGTYPSEDGSVELRQAAHKIEGAELARTDDGAVLLIDPSSAKSAHLAYPGGDSQIEVYSPVPGQALRIAKRGEVQPIP